MDQTETNCLYRDVSRPTAIQHSTRACFISPFCLNIIAVKAGLLEIYDVDIEAGKPITSYEFTQQDLKHTPTTRNFPTLPSISTLKQSATFHSETPPILKLHTRSKLYGNVVDIKPLFIPGQTTESLVLAFDDGVISVVHWDPLTQSLVTVFTHDGDVRDLSIPYAPRHDEESEADPSNTTTTAAGGGALPASDPGHGDLLQTKLALEHGRALTPLIEVDSSTGLLVVVQSKSHLCFYLPNPNHHPHLFSPGAATYYPSPSESPSTVPSASATAEPSSKHGGQQGDSVVDHTTGSSSSQHTASYKFRHIDTPQHCVHLLSTITSEQFAFTALPPIPITSMNPSILSVKDIILTSSSQGVSLVCLCSTELTWEGRYASKRHSSSLLSIALQYTKQRAMTTGGNLPSKQPVTSQPQMTVTPFQSAYVPNLGFDCYALSPVPRPFTGCLVLTPSSVLYYNLHRIEYGCKLNCYDTQQSDTTPTLGVIGSGIRLDRANATCVYAAIEVPSPDVPPPTRRLAKQSGSGSSSTAKTKTKGQLVSAKKKSKASQDDDLDELDDLLNDTPSQPSSKQSSSHSVDDDLDELLGSPSSDTVKTEPQAQAGDDVSQKPESDDENGSTPASSKVNIDVYKDFVNSSYLSHPSLVPFIPYTQASFRSEFQNTKLKTTRYMEFLILTNTGTSYLLSIYAKGTSITAMIPQRIGELTPYSHFQPIVLGLDVSDDRFEQSQDLPAKIVSNLVHGVTSSLLFATSAYGDSRVLHFERQLTLSETTDENAYMNRNILTYNRLVDESEDGYPMLTNLEETPEGLLPTIHHVKDEPASSHAPRHLGADDDDNMTDSAVSTSATGQPNQKPSDDAYGDRVDISLLKQLGATIKAEQNATPVKTDDDGTTPPANQAPHTDTIKPEGEDGQNAVATADDDDDQPQQEQDVDEDDESDDLDVVRRRKRKHARPLVPPFSIYHRDSYPNYAPLNSLQTYNSTPLHPNNSSSLTSLYDEQLGVQSSLNDPEALDASTKVSVLIGVGGRNRDGKVVTYTDCLVPEYITAHRHQGRSEKPTSVGQAAPLEAPSDGDGPITNIYTVTVNSQEQYVVAKSHANPKGVEIYDPLLALLELRYKLRRAAQAQSSGTTTGGGQPTTGTSTTSTAAQQQQQQQTQQQPMGPTTQLAVNPDAPILIRRYQESLQQFEHYNQFISLSTPDHTFDSNIGYQASALVAVSTAHSTTFYRPKDTPIEEFTHNLHVLTSQTNVLKADQQTVLLRLLQAAELTPSETTSRLITNQRTIAMGNVLGSLKAWVQVTPTRVQLCCCERQLLCSFELQPYLYSALQNADALPGNLSLEDVHTQQQQHRMIEQTSIMHAEILDPYVILHLSNHTVLKIEYTSDPSSLDWYTCDDITPIIRAPHRAATFITQNNDKTSKTFKSGVQGVQAVDVLPPPILSAKEPLAGQSGDDPGVTSDTDQQDTDIYSLAVVSVDLLTLIPQLKSLLASPISTLERMLDFYENNATTTTAGVDQLDILFDEEFNKDAQAQKASAGTGLSSHRSTLSAPSALVPLPQVQLLFVCIGNRLVIMHVPTSHIVFIGNSPGLSLNSLINSITAPITSNIEISDYNPVKEMVVGQFEQERDGHIWLCGVTPTDDFMVYSIRSCLLPGLVYQLYSTAKTMLDYLVTHVYDITPTALGDAQHSTRQRRSAKSTTAVTFVSSMNYEKIFSTTTILDVYIQYSHFLQYDYHLSTLLSSNKQHQDRRQFQHVGGEARDTTMDDMHDGGNDDRQTDSDGAHISLQYPPPPFLGSSRPSSISIVDTITALSIPFETPPLTFSTDAMLSLLMTTISFPLVLRLEYSSVANRLFLIQKQVIDLEIAQRPLDDPALMSSSTFNTIPIVPPEARTLCRIENMSGNNGVLITGLYPIFVLFSNNNISAVPYYHQPYHHPLSVQPETPQELIPVSRSLLAATQITLPNMRCSFMLGADLHNTIHSSILPARLPTCIVEQSQLRDESYTTLRTHVRNVLHCRDNYRYVSQINEMAIKTSLTDNSSCKSLDQLVHQTAQLGASIDAILYRDTSAPQHMKSSIGDDSDLLKDEEPSLAPAKKAKPAATPAAKDHGDGDDLDDLLGVPQPSPKKSLRGRDAQAASDDIVALTGKQTHQSTRSPASLLSMLNQASSLTSQFALFCHQFGLQPVDKYSLFHACYATRLLSHPGRSRTRTFLRLSTSRCISTDNRWNTEHTTHPILHVSSLHDTTYHHVTSLPLPLQASAMNYIYSDPGHGIFRQKNLNETPLFCKIHEKTNILAILTQTMIEGGSTEFIDEDDAIPIYVSSFRLDFYDLLTGEKKLSHHLINPVQKEMTSSIKTDESVTALDYIELEGKTYLCVSSAIRQGPEMTAKGRLTFIELYYARGVSHSGYEQEFLKLKTFQHTEKFPVSGVAVVESVLAVTSGYRVFLYHVDAVKQKLIGQAFYECSYLCIGIHTIKNIIIVNDIFRSVTLLVWDSRNRSLTLFARHAELVPVSHSAKLINDDVFDIIVADIHRNVQLLRYNITDTTSIRYKRLVCQAQFHCGTTVLDSVTSSSHTLTQINDSMLTLLASYASKVPRVQSLVMTLLAHRLHPQFMDKEFTYIYKQRQTTRQLIYRSQTEAIPHYLSQVNHMLRSAATCGTQDGSIVQIASLDKLTHSRISALRVILAQHYPFPAGLDPLVYREYKGSLIVDERRHNRDVVDSSILQMFLQLPLSAKRVISRGIGTSPTAVIDTLKYIEASLSLHALL